ncbi:hypothetical protein ANCDUO_06401 [Ancylostoma duodenale]|uniref:Uncharacterized protein n=1 Tax=Ancylostoma duodenale TaxID=51022 RepID=A0A0C2DL13_9BILA|nr:hypothetical protein ANCDUO_06401 [Ancylostoma duodenale]
MAHAHVVPAPIVAPAPVVAPPPIVAPAPVVAPAPGVAPAPVFPYAMHYHHHHPRAEVRNIVRAYARETGHTSDTAMVSGDDHHGHHGFGLWDHFPLGHFSDDHHHDHHYPFGHYYGGFGFHGPWHQKLTAKKVAKSMKTFEKKN